MGGVTSQRPLLTSYHTTFLIQIEQTTYFMGFERLEDEFLPLARPKQQFLSYIYDTDTRMEQNKFIP